MNEGQVNHKLDTYTTQFQQILEKLYFYALKKTGNSHEAEDFAQEVLTEAWTSLRNGSRPEHFAYWIWGIARHRYARWAARKHKASGFLSNYDEKIDETPDIRRSVDQTVIFQENIELLYRELALLSSYYREITVSYYIHCEKIADISKKLNLPEGTIKRRLYESRKNLKEGMQMAREKGKRSYLAENITFSKSGSDGKDGSPWKLTQRKIPKNILLAAYRNPLSLEELCLEMGIAMPYMEEEVQLLTGGTLLKEVSKGVYETDFIIVDAEMQMDIFNKLLDISNTFCPKIIEYLDSHLDRIRAVGFMGHQLPTETLYWEFIPATVDMIIDIIQDKKKVPPQYTKRPHSGQWDITGYEECELPFRTFVGHNGSGKPETGIFWTYKIRIDNLWDRAGELYSNEVSVLAEALRNKKTLSTLSQVEKNMIQDLMRRGFVEQSETEIHPTFIVMTSEQKDQVWSMLNSGELSALIDQMEQMYDYVYERIGKSVPKRLNDQLKFVTINFLYDLRMTSLRYALDQQRIRIPDDVNKSTIAMHMVIPD